MKRIKVIIYRIFKPRIMDDCVQSAYVDFHYLLENVFTNLYEAGFTMKYEEFILIFEKYDWEDFIDCLENLENSDLINIDNVWNDELMDTLISQINNTISSKWENSYFWVFINK